MRRLPRVDVQQLNFDGLTDAVTNLVGALLLLVILVQGLAQSAPATRSPQPQTPPARSMAPVLADAEISHAELARLDRATRSLLRQARNLHEQAQALLAQPDSGRRPPPLASLPVPTPHESLAQSLQADRLHAQTLEQALDGTAAWLTELDRELAAFQPPVPQPQPADEAQLRFRPPFEHAVNTQPMSFLCRQQRVYILPDSLSVQRAIGNNVPPEGVIRPASGDFDLKQDGSGVYALVLKDGHPGEDWPAAQAAGSRFRRWLSDSRPTAHHVEFYVYPDSFSLFRSLRQICWDEGYAVNWSPLASDETLRAGLASGPARVVQ